MPVYFIYLQMFRWLYVYICFKGYRPVSSSPTDLLKVLSALLSFLTVGSLQVLPRSTSFLRVAEFSPASVS